eukprot:SAG22_NODE_3330_length_1775_cov_1.610382_1_plen_229_part_00
MYGGVHAVDWLSADELPAVLIKKPVGQMQGRLEEAYQNLLAVAPLEAQQAGPAGIGAVGIVGFIRTMTAIATALQKKHAIVVRRHELVSAQLRKGELRRGGQKGLQEKVYAEMTKLQKQHLGLNRDQDVYNAIIGPFASSQAYDWIMSFGSQKMIVTARGKEGKDRVPLKRNPIDGREYPSDDPNCASWDPSGFEGPEDEPEAVSFDELLANMKMDGKPSSFQSGANK